MAKSRQNLFAVKHWFGAIVIARKQSLGHRDDPAGIALFLLKWFPKFPIPVRSAYSPSRTQRAIPLGLPFRLDSSACVGCAVAAIIMACSVARADQASIDRFLREYPAASKMLQSRLTRVKGACVLKYQPNPKYSPGPGITKRAIFAADHGFRKVLLSRDKGKAGMGEAVYCIGDVTGFSLQKSAGDPSYSIGATGSDRRMIGAVYNTLFGRYLESAYFIGPQPLANYMSEPTFRVVSANEVVVGSEHLIRVECEAGSSETPVKLMAELDPASGWSIRRGECRSRGPVAWDRASVEVEYSTLVDGTKTPHVVRYRDVTGETIICDFESVQFEPTDEREFRMSFYGLPELSSAPSYSTPSNVYLLICVSLLGIVLAFALRRASKRWHPRLSGG